MDKSRYTKVFDHKGVEIYTLKVACLSQGDKLGYVIDNKKFEGKEFVLLSEALEAINKELCDFCVEEIATTVCPACGSQSCELCVSEKECLNCGAELLHSQNK